MKQMLRSTSCKWPIQKIHTMKSMGFVSNSIISFLEKLKIPFIRSELFIFDEKASSKKTWSYRTIHWLDTYLKSKKWSSISYSTGKYTYFNIKLRQQEMILRRCACLTRKPHFKGKLEQMDNTLPGQLLQVRKIDHRYGLINIVISYYNW